MEFSMDGYPPPPVPLPWKMINFPPNFFSNKVCVIPNILKSNKLCLIRDIIFMENSMKIYIFFNPSLRTYFTNMFLEINQFIIIIIMQLCLLRNLQTLFEIYYNNINVKVVTICVYDLHFQSQIWTVQSFLYE